MSHNRVTIFSNGIADFQQFYELRRDRPKEISIPVKKQHVGDVLASLNVFGQVTLVSPPSFRPANELKGNLAIVVDNVIENLATSLSGAKVEIEKAGSTVEGTLVGLHTEPEGTGGQRVEPKYLVLFGEQGLRKIAIKEVQALRFQDEAVSAEIEKSLQRGFQAIKPRSTFVDLVVKTEEEQTEAIVRYTVPAAAWKISYRLRMRAEGGIEFQGFAVVDNNTEEDWNDCLITVVTGEPITFSTDLAHAKTPGRKHVDVVRGVALGAVEVEESISGFADASIDFTETDPMPAKQDSDAETALFSAQMVSTGGRYLNGGAAARAQEPVAEMALPDSREVGDLCIFEAPSPVSIGANRSAVIPVFSTTMDTGQIVLHYKSENYHDRPFRSIEFTNETEASLGRGVCTVFEEGTYSGSCIIPSTKPGENCLLPHALETGVRVHKSEMDRTRKKVRLRLAQGFCHTTFRESRKTIYAIKSSRDETLDLILDHDRLFPDSETAVTLIRSDGNETSLGAGESLANGIRLRMPLAARESMTIEIIESRPLEASVQLAAPLKLDLLNSEWLEKHLVASKGPLAGEPGIHQCLDIQRRLGDKRHKIREAHETIDRLATRQERLRKNLATGGHDDQTNQWKTDLGKTEDRIVLLEETAIPSLSEEELAIKQELSDALMTLAAEWHDEPTDGPE